MDIYNKHTPFNPDVLPASYFKQAVEVVEVEVTGHPKRYLIPGAIVVSKDPLLITTILGSSIAVCLWDSKNGIGGMNHFTQTEGGVPGNTKYAEAANEELLRQMMQCGANLISITASVFGGSLPAVSFGDNGKCLGARNLEAAERFLAQKGIVIRERETGGVSGRKLVFQTDNGKARSKQL